MVVLAGWFGCGGSAAVDDSLAVGDKLLTKCVLCAANLIEAAKVEKRVSSVLKAAFSAN